jgi:predicted amidohydrolase
VSTSSAEIAPARTVRVRCHELGPVAGDLEANVAAIDAAIREAVDAGVELLVLPELSASGYYLTPEEARACALDSQSGRFERWAAMLPAGVVVVLGFPELAGETLYNSAAILTSNGVAAIYRKTHLWDAEADLFTPGDDPPPVVETPVGRLGVLICYDLEFPEMPRQLALRGAELIAVPTNWPLVPRPSGEHPPEVVMAMAAARASATPIVCCDRRGAERGYDWTEGTVILGSDGWRMGHKTDVGVLDADLVISPTRSRIGDRNDVLTDRRPELYR